MRITHSRSQAAGCAIACGLLLGLAACSKNSNPLAPPPPPGPAPVSITIGGTTSLERPGSTGHLTATVTLSDQSSRDVTAEAMWWSSRADVANVTSPGAVTAEHYGIANITAAYQGLRTEISLRVAPPGACLLRGFVRSEAGLPLADARVEFSSRCGTVAVMTDRNGFFWLPADGGVGVRVELDGYQPLVQEMTATDDQWVSPFVLQAFPLPDSISGDYKLTVTASPSCTLQPEFRQRHYDAHIVEIRHDLFVELKGARMFSWEGRPGFTGTRDGSAVQFSVNDYYNEEFQFIEVIDEYPTRTLSYSGAAAGEARQGTITAVFNGAVVLRSNAAGVLALCQATDHRFELVRSNGS